MITIEHAGGVGVHMHLRIRENGVHVATIDRPGFRSGWRIQSVYYGLNLGSGWRSIDTAKAAALALNYPTASEVYETICTRTEAIRRTHKEKACGPELARLAREIIAGSNSARHDLEQLIETIDAYIVDRTDTRARRQAECDREYEKTGVRTYVSEGHETFYPDAPDMRYPDERKAS